VRVICFAIAAASLSALAHVEAIVSRTVEAPGIISPAPVIATIQLYRTVEHLVQIYLASFI
jgi:hypothetical protein